MMRIAILCHSNGVAHWQAQAIRLISETHELVLLRCKPSPRPRLRTGNLGYYALNLVSVRNSMTRRVPIPIEAFVETRDFEPTFDGAWAVLPQSLLDWLRERGIDAVVKCALGLLRIPDGVQLPAPILSYHHGDPGRFRGRPAGFYELAGEEQFIGQVVQILGNKLDSGEVLAFAQSRVVPHSYRKTLVDAYRLSPHLLPKAVQALADGIRIPIARDGKNHRLPSNGAVARFLMARLAKLARRAAYGALVEKSWSVGEVTIAKASDPQSAIRDCERKRTDWIIPARLEGFSFYADPFFHSARDDFLVEAMNARSGRGELVRIRGGRQERITGFNGHISYPGSVAADGRLYLLPEISDWGRPALFRLDGNRACLAGELDCGGSHLIDPTVAEIDGRFFLFANTVEDGPSILHLWSAKSLFGRFEQHPSSPIRISARGSRMAGELVWMDGLLYRLGQDFKDSYGDGILVFRIDAMDAQTYREELAGEAAFQSVRGPHTVNFRDGLILFDWYEERHTPLAGVRRLLNRAYRIMSG